MIAKGKVLELIVDGTRKGSIHVYITTKLEIVKINLPNEILEKVKIKNLINKKQDYSMLGYKLYKMTLEKGFQKSFPEHQIIIREKNIGRLENLYGKYIKEQKFYLL